MYTTSLDWNSVVVCGAHGKLCDAFELSKSPKNRKAASFWDAATVMLCQIPFQTQRVVFPASLRRFTRCEGFNIHAHKTLPVQCPTSSQSWLSYPYWYHPDTAATSCSVLCPCWYHPDTAATSCSVLCPCWYHPDTAATSCSVLCPCWYHPDTAATSCSVLLGVIQSLNYTCSS